MIKASYTFTDSFHLKIDRSCVAITSYQLLSGHGMHHKDHIRITNYIILYFREENEALTSEFEEQNTLMDELKRKLNSIKEKNSQLKAMNEEQERTNEQLRKNVEEARMQISSLEKLIEKVQQESITANAEKDRLVWQNLF